MTFSIDECLQRLATRNRGRTEADIQRRVRETGHLSEEES